jgi:sensor domain CHASE-containing protein/prefoldin subunit 5
MSLRKQTLLIITIVMVGLIGLLYAITQFILLDSYRQLEDQDTRQNVQRTLNTLANELESLSATTADYARWDDTYAFVEDGNEDYIAQNLTDSSFVNLGVNFMIFANVSGEIVFQKAVDLETGVEHELPTGLDLAPESPLFHHADNESSVAGILIADEGPILIASRPILDSLLERPTRGSLIFGQLLDAAKIDTLSQSLSLPMTFYETGSDALPADFRAALTEKSPVTIHPLTGEQIAGYALINDLENRPALMLRIDLPRDIYNQGWASIRLFLVLLLVVGLVVAIVIALLLDRIVIGPLTHLSRDVDSITQAGIQGRVSVSGQNELADLARDINRMLETLEQAQKTVRESDQRLQTVVNSAPIILWAADNTHKLALLEGRGLDFLEISPGQGVGSLVSKTLGNIPQLIDEMNQAFGGEAVSSIMPVKDLTFDASCTPIRNGEGTVVSVIGVAVNITERMMAEEALGTAHKNLDIQKRQLERSRELLRATLDQLNDTFQRGASQDEIKEYLAFVRTQMKSVE